jgi:succinate dehydrogenase flavin-adding protein (antitoxin of CptAB toxin-antitoxin module)
MSRMRTITPGLILRLGLAVIVPVGAQAQAMPSKGDVRTTFRSLINFSPQYIGLTLSDAQTSVFRKILDATSEEIRAARQLEVPGEQHQKLRDSIIARRDTQLYAALTTEQRETVAKNLQVLAVFRTFDTQQAFTERVRMLMGLNLTDQQLAAVKKLLEGEDSQLRAALQAASLPESATRTNNPIRYRQSGKMIEAFYAVLTPAQQKAAAPEYERQKMYFAAFTTELGK